MFNKCLGCLGPARELTQGSVPIGHLELHSYTVRGCDDKSERKAIGLDNITMQTINSVAGHALLSL